MSTAYGPHLYPFSVVAGGAITEDTPKVAGTVTVLSTTNVNERVWLHGMIEVSAGADTDGVTVTVYRGDVATGTIIMLCRNSSDGFAGVDNVVFIDALDDLGADIQSQLYTVTVTCTSASADGNLGDVVLVATVF